MRVRTEEPGDRAEVHAINTAAFGTAVEANLVDTLRARNPGLISLVAEMEGAAVGHILFSPVSLADHSHLRIMGLGPMAVVPQRQREGVGSALVRGGLERCREMGYDAVVVVGHPEYYPRFGFVPAARYGVSCEFDVPDDVFMILELRAGALRGVSGVVRYDEIFSRI